MLRKEMNKRLEKASAEMEYLELEARDAGQMEMERVFREIKEAIRLWEI